MAQSSARNCMYLMLQPNTAFSTARLDSNRVEAKKQTITSKSQANKALQSELAKSLGGSRRQQKILDLTTSVVEVRTQLQQRPTVEAHGALEQELRRRPTIEAHQALQEELRQRPTVETDTAVLSELWRRPTVEAHRALQQQLDQRPTLDVYRDLQQRPTVEAHQSLQQQLQQRPTVEAYRAIQRQLATAIVDRNTNADHLIRCEEELTLCEAIHNDGAVVLSSQLQDITSQMQIEVELRQATECENARLRERSLSIEAELVRRRDGEDADYVAEVESHKLTRQRELLVEQQLQKANSSLEAVKAELKQSKLQHSKAHEDRQECQASLDEARKTVLDRDNTIQAHVQQATALEQENETLRKQLELLKIEKGFVDTSSAQLSQQLETLQDGLDTPSTQTPKQPFSLQKQKSTVEDDWFEAMTQARQDVFRFIYDYLGVDPPTNSDQGLRDDMMGGIPGFEQATATRLSTLRFLMELKDDINGRLIGELDKAVQRFENQVREVEGIRTEEREERDQMILRLDDEKQEYRRMLKLAEEAMERAIEKYKTDTQKLADSNSFLLSEVTRRTTAHNELMAEYNKVVQFIETELCEPKTT